MSVTSSIRFLRPQFLISTHAFTTRISSFKGTSSSLRFSGTLQKDSKGGNHIRYIACPGYHGRPFDYIQCVKKEMGINLIFYMRLAALAFEPVWFDTTYGTFPVADDWKCLVRSVFD